MPLVSLLVVTNKKQHRSKIPCVVAGKGMRTTNENGLFVGSSTFGTDPQDSKMLDGRTDLNPLQITLRLVTSSTCHETNARHKTLHFSHNMLKTAAIPEPQERHDATTRNNQLDSYHSRMHYQLHLSPIIPSPCWKQVTWIRCFSVR